MRMFQVCVCGQPLQLNEKPTPEPAGTEVLLKVQAAGVCHSDIHIWDGYYELGGGKRLQLLERGIKLPLTMGHENVGEVVAVGPDAKGVKVGDVRLANPWIGCGECVVCKVGEENLCKTPRNLGVFTDGGYATHLIVPHPRHLFDIGKLTPVQAAPLACSGITAFSALKKVGPVIKDEPVVIMGAGGLGLMAIALHKAMGGKSVVMVDIDPVKREAALKAGAIAAIDGRAPDAAKQIIAATNGGAWSVIDFVGSSDTVQARHRLAGDQRRQDDRRRPVRRRRHGLDAVLPDARDDHPGLLCRLAAGDEGTARTGQPHRRAAGADARAPARRSQRRAQRSAGRQGDRPRRADADDL